MFDLRVEGQGAERLCHCNRSRPAFKERFRGGDGPRHWRSARSDPLAEVDLGGGQYDWSSVKAVQEAATECKITPIWDLCHYGFPDGCDPFSEECLERFAAYCRAAAQFVTSSARGPYFFTPVNEITFFSAAASDLEWMYPFAKGRECELKRALARMDIAGVKAIREVQPDARMVHVDPIVHAVPPPGRPDLADEARDEEHRKAMEPSGHARGTRCSGARRFAGDPRYRRSQRLPVRPGSGWTATTSTRRSDRAIRDEDRLSELLGSRGTGTMGRSSSGRRAATKTTAPSGCA